VSLLANTARLPGLRSHETIEFVIDGDLPAALSMGHAYRLVPVTEDGDVFLSVMKFGMLILALLSLLPRTTDQSIHVSGDRIDARFPPEYRDV
jgi:hypothetical protein